MRTILTWSFLVSILFKYCMRAQLLSRVWLWDPTDCSPPGSSVHGILQARILEWVATPSSRGSFWPRDRTGVSCISCTAGKFFPAEPLGKPWGEKRDGVSPEIKLHPESPWIAGCSARTQFMARTCPATAPCPFSSWGGTAAEGTLVSLVRGCRAPGCYGALPTDSPQLRPLAPWLQSGGDCTKCSGVFEIQF